MSLSCTVDSFLGVIPSVVIMRLVCVLQRPQTAGPAPASGAPAGQGCWGPAEAIAAVRPKTAIPAQRASPGHFPKGPGPEVEQMRGSMEGLPVPPVRDRMKHAVQRESVLRYL